MSRFPSGPFGMGQPRPLDYEARAARVSPSVLATFFNMVYAWMAAGLALTALVAWWVSTRPDIMASIFRGPVLLILVVAELALVWVISASVNRISASAATGLFLLYSALNGLTLSIIFVVYTRTSLASAFIVTAGMFGAMSLYGFVTKRDLTRLGSLLFMALIGLILASMVNVFWPSPGVYWAVTYAGVLIFVGLTAYDTQMLKYLAFQTEGDAALSARMAVAGALRLYLDFINLFLFMLRLLGSRRD